MINARWTSDLNHPVPRAMSLGAETLGDLTPLVLTTVIAGWLMFVSGLVRGGFDLVSPTVTGCTT